MQTHNYKHLMLVHCMFHKQTFQFTQIMANLPDLVLHRLVHLQIVAWTMQIDLT